MSHGYFHHDLTRRRFIQLAAGGVTVSILSGLLAACGGDEDDDPAPTATTVTGGAPTATSISDATPAVGGEATATSETDTAAATATMSEPVAEMPFADLVARLPQGGNANLGYAIGQPAHLDAQLTSATLTRLASAPVNDWLVRFDADSEIVHSLATAVEIVDDLTIQFTIRQGVKFHNGRTMIADDVKQNMDRVKDPANASPYGSSLTAVESVEVVDDETVVFHLSSPFPGLLGNLTRIPIIPLEAAAEMKTNPVGAGPFKFKEWVADSHIDYERYDEYWDPEQPRLDTIRTSFLHDYAAGKASFQSAEQDVLFSIPLTDVTVFESMAADGFHAKAWQDMHFTYLAMNQANEPYNNVKVRQAIQLAIDPEAFNLISFGGYGEPTHIPIRRGTPFYFEDHQYQRPDVERARQLLTEAGFPDGFDDEVIIPNSAKEGTYGPLIQNQLAEIGINLSILLMEVGPFVERTLQQKDYNICMLSDVTLPDPSFLIERYLKSDGGANLFNYNSPQMDDLLTSAGSTYDFDERLDLYKQAMKLMIDDAAWQIVLNCAASDAYRDPVLYDAGFWVPHTGYIFGLLASG